MQNLYILKLNFKNLLKTREMLKIDAFKTNSPLYMNQTFFWSINCERGKGPALKHANCC